MLRTGYCGVFQNTSFSFLYMKQEWFFSDIYCENLVEFLEVNLTALWGQFMTGWVPLELITLRLVHKAFSSLSSILQGFFLHFCWFPWLFLLQSLLLQESVSSFICLSLSLILRQQSACVLPSSMDPKTIIDFSVCSAFYLILEWSDDF